MEKLKNYLFYGTLNKREWPLVRDAIWRSNRFLLLTVSFSLFVLMTVLAIYTFAFDHVYRNNAAAYGMIALIELTIYLVAKAVSKTSLRFIPLLTLIFNFIMFVFGVALGTFLDPGSYALAFVVMIIVLPMLFCVRPIHSISSVFVMGTAFLLVSHHFKEPDIFYADVLNLIIWGIMGNFLLAITTKARVRQQFEYYKNEEAQKEVRESFKQLGTQMAMFKSLGNIYSALYYIDLKMDSYVELVSLPESRAFFGNSGGDAGKRLQDYCVATVAEYYKAQMREFTNLQNIQDRLKTENIVSMQYQVPVGSGIKKKMVWRELSVIAVNRDESNEVVSILYATREIDAEKQNEIKQMDRLQQALVAAESANKSKTIFLNNMSHDIRTPMNAISGFTVLAHKHADDAVLVRDYLDKISVANKHLISLVNDVLDMSRIESGRINLNLRPESIESIVGELKTLVQEDCTARRQTLTVNTEQVKHDYLRCDRLRVKQVLLSLLSNAIKFTPNGGQIDFEIDEIESGKPGYAGLRIVVRDNGIGMSEEFLKKVFLPFEREESRAINGVQGAGLGMAIAKNLVDMMEGFIYVRSTLNVGTEVLLEVAFEISSEPKEYEGISAERPVTILPRQFAGKRILLVEDNRMNQMIARHLLRESGVDILVAENGQMAYTMLEKCGPGYFGVILMDIQMPVMDGYETARMIRKMRDKSLAETPIIAMTAEVYQEDREKALAAGMNGHISKPVEANQLFSALLKIWG